MRKSQLILVVEDDADAREAVAEFLAIHGYEVAAAENGKAALDLLRHGWPLPKLILLDLQMPIMDGYALLRRLRHDWRLRKVPVIVTTADPEPRKVEALTLTKPVKPDRLLDVVRRFVPMETARQASAAVAASR